ncbi:hypothetical protein DSM112329_02082 [Paraconexibacter sp. AEG42_29]|uniref:Branched-chain amino acid ABC transporter permease n=2 Tax=Paraconexibacter sp. AEG42_29 TaxID=2997339 RepID=A0AAU7AU72_9ACTN
MIVAALAGLALLLSVPFFLGEFWLQTGLFSMAGAIAAIGLTILVGRTGQLSLGHAFFLAVGAYGYCYFAGGEQIPGLKEGPSGLELPPAIALVGAMLLAGVAGALFAPIAGRLHGIYLGIASIGLVFLGQHIMFNAETLTGGFNGRDAIDFSIFGYGFDDGDGTSDFGELEKLWYLGLFLLAVSAWVAHNIVGGRPGRAFETLRDSTVAAATMGVDVRRTRATAFVLSSMYAGLGGALLAIAYGRIVPETFGFVLSIEFLVIVVLGGLGSVNGAILGAIVVFGLPQIFSNYADSLPLVSEPGSGGVGPTQLSRYLFGAAIIAVLLMAQGGLAGIGRTLRARLHARHAPHVPEPAP